MNRRSSKKDNRFKQFEGLKSSERHIRITESMFFSEAWRDLKSTSRDLYQLMKFRYNGSNQECIELPYSEAAKVISKNIITACYGDLIAHGFIEVISEGRIARKPNVYKLSDKWQRWPNIEVRQLTAIVISTPKNEGSTTPKNKGSKFKKTLGKVVNYPQ